LELSDNLYSKILLLSEEGEKFFEKSEFDNAINRFKEAVDLLPIPKTQWEAGLWLFTALGDVYFLKKEYNTSSTYLFDALNCPNGHSNPFVLCRLGQALFEMQSFEKSKEYLLKAYMLDGFEVLKGEDPKYKDFLIKYIK
jgi:tetratricopeptide (TPR) repeat protein